MNDSDLVGLSGQYARSQAARRSLLYRASVANSGQARGSTNNLSVACNVGAAIAN
jgi:hypothetical protein